MQQGTAKQLQEAGAKINGICVDGVALSVLAKYSMVKIIGKEVRPEGAKGKPATIYMLPEETKEVQA